MSAIDFRFLIDRGGFVLDVAETIPAQGVTALFGPSGCGKTTILRAIAGLERAPIGQLQIGSQTWQSDTAFLPPHRRPVGYVFQEASLFDHLSVKANLVYGQKRSKTQARVTFEETVSLLGITPLLERSVRRLSGGERQRVAIGRALLSGPDVLLMDEPMAALDRQSKDDILPYLEKLARSLSIPVILVSHDLEEVKRLAHHLVLMERGKVVANRPLADILTDPLLPLAALPDAESIMEGSVTALDERYGLATFKVGPTDFQVAGRVGQVGETRRLRIRATDVALSLGRAAGGSSILNGPVARVSHVEADGVHRVTVFLRLGERGEGPPLIARISRKSWDSLELASGSRVHALIKGVALVD